VLAKVAGLGLVSGEDVVEAAVFSDDHHHAL
jgi:hypothetical protein